jgi:hypothetical protein
LQDPSFRSSKRSVQFLQYVVEKTLNGQAEQIKERTIGVDVFGRRPSYDTNEDHVVRTAAVELRKRLTIYYSNENHRTELRMSLVPGSYIPQFTPPAQNSEIAGTGSHNDPAQHAESRMVASTLLEFHPGIEAATPAAFRKHRLNRSYVISAIIASALLFGILGNCWLSPTNAQNLFWKPVLDTPRSVLLAVGGVPNGLPTLSVPTGDQEYPIPVVQKTPSQIVRFGDAVRLHVSSGHWSRREKTSSSGEKERVLSPICAKGHWFW